MKDTVLFAMRLHEFLTVRKMMYVFSYFIYPKILFNFSTILSRFDFGLIPKTRASAFIFASINLRSVRPSQPTGPLSAAPARKEKTGN